MLRIEALVAGYGKHQVLSGVSIEAPPQEVTVIVGPNGSGKSTLLKSVSGLTKIFSGKIQLDGEKELSGLTPHNIARIGVAYLPQTDNIFTNLSVSENLTLAAYTIDKDEKEVRIKEVLEAFPQLSAYMKTRALNLSGGERQMLAMAMALIRRPSVLMFDEPTANLAPRIAMQVLTTIVALAKERGLTILLVEQNAKRALEIGDNAYLLVGGNKAFEGSARNLLEHKEFGKLYLGLKTA